MYEDYLKIAQEVRPTEDGIRVCHAIEDLVDMLLRKDRIIRTLEKELSELRTESEWGQWLNG